MNENWFSRKKITRKRIYLSINILEIFQLGTIHLPLFSYIILIFMYRLMMLGIRKQNNLRSTSVWPDTVNLLPEGLILITSSFMLGCHLESPIRFRHINPAPWVSPLQNGARSPAILSFCLQRWQHSSQKSLRLAESQMSTLLARD